MAQRQWRSDDTDPWLYGFGDGSDGDLTISADTTEAPIDSSCSGTSGTTSLAATNASFVAGQIILIHQTTGTGAGGWELNKIDSYTAGTITTKHALTMTYTDSGSSQAQVRVLKQYNNVTVDSTKTYTAKAWGGDVGGIFGFLAKGTVTVNGTISGVGLANSVGTGGAGIGYRGGSTANGAGTANQGEGSAGPGGASTAANGSGGGGAYSSTGTAAGGGGGSAAAGGNGTADAATPGTGGSAVGVASLVTIFPGGGGGGGRRNTLTNHAGAGGGCMLFIFAEILVVAGAITLAGGSSTTSGGGVGGGGAGGSGLFKCVTATLGTALITAPGGTGATCWDKPAKGGNGSVGRFHIDYSGSYTGTTTPTIDATNDTTIVQPLSAGGAFLYNFI